MMYVMGNPKWVNDFLLVYGIAAATPVCQISPCFFALALVRPDHSLNSRELALLFSREALAIGDGGMLYPLRGKAYIDMGCGGKLILGRLPHTKLYEF